MDQLDLRNGQHNQAQVVHHILPREQYPQYAWSRWNLISLTSRNHELMHNRLTGELSTIGRDLMMETAAKRGIKLSRLVLVAGLPGTGKSAYVRQHLGGGVAYDLDYIAGAFRLREPHAEYHKPARRMAASMAAAFAANARQFSPDVFIVKTAPTLEEVAEMMPDEIVICQTQHDISDRKDFEKYADYSEEAERLIALKEWAEANGVIIVHA